MNGDEIIVQAPGNEPGNDSGYDHLQNAEEGPWHGRVEDEEVEYFELNPDDSNDFIIFE